MTEQEQNIEQVKEQQLNDNLGRIKHKLIVLSGKGGVGKSTVAVNLAYGLALQGKRTGILDIDIHGPNVVKMMGIENKQFEVPKDGGAPSPIQVTENLWAMSIAMLLTDSDAPIIWRGPLKMGAIKQFMQDLIWPELDYLIVDCPPGTGDEPLSAIQILGKMDGSIIVSTPQDVAYLDARKTMIFSFKLEVPVLGLIENMSYFACPHCGEKTQIYKGSGTEKAIDDFNVELLGSLPIDPAIAATGDAGRPYIYDFAKQEAAKELQKVVEKVIEKTS